MFVDRIAQGSQKLHLSDGEYEVTDQDQEKQAKAASAARSDTGVIEPPEGTEFHKGILSTGALSAQGTRSPWGRAAVFFGGVRFEADSLIADPMPESGEPVSPLLGDGYPLHSLLFRYPDFSFTQSSAWPTAVPI